MQPKWIPDNIVSQNSEVHAQSFYNSMGSTEEDLHKGGFIYRSQEETVNALGYCKGYGSIEIKYYDITKNELPFRRFRFLGPPELVGKSKYIQQGAGLEVYFPPNVDWEKVIENKSAQIGITEGEKKAYIASKYGLPTIGLGGVYSICSLADREKGLLFIERLNSIVLKNRKVYILFDYDGDGSGKHKPHVELAANILMSKLLVKQAEVYNVMLGYPGLKEKVGADDYILTNGPEKFFKLLEKTVEYQSQDSNKPYLGICEALSKYANLNGKVIKLETSAILSGHQAQIDMAPIKDQSGKPIWHTWLGHRHRINLSSISFDPAVSERLIHTTSGQCKLNMWNGIKTAPFFGDISEWLKVKSILFRQEPELEQHFDLYWACLLQKPEHKQYRIMQMVSEEEGVGKSYLMEAFVFIITGQFSPNVSAESYAELNAAICGPTELSSDFNGWVENKIYVVFNEAKDAHEYNQSNLLKNYVTGHTISSNRKQIERAPVNNYMNLAQSSNSISSLAVTKDSRRDMPLIIPRGTKELVTPFFMNSLGAKKWDEKYLSAIAYYYMNYDLGSYTGRDDSPRSASLVQAMKRSGSLVSRYMNEYLESAIFIDVAREHNLYLKEVYGDINSSKGSTRAAFKEELRKVGFIPLIKAMSQRGYISLAAYGFHKKIEVWARVDQASEEYYPKIADELHKRYDEIEQEAKL